MRKLVEVTIEGVVVVVQNGKIGTVEAGAGAHHKDQDIRGMFLCKKDILYILFLHEDIKYLLFLHEDIPYLLFFCGDIPYLSALFWYPYLKRNITVLDTFLPH
jgi:hypothetical protein